MLSWNCWHYKFLKINDFMYFWQLWVFISVHGLSLVVVSKAYSSLQWQGFSLQWLLLSRSTGPSACGISSCRTWAQSLCLRNLIAPWHVGSSRTRDWSYVPVLAGRFLSTGPSEKSRILKEFWHQEFLKNWTPEGSTLTRWSRTTCWT